MENEIIIQKQNTAIIAKAWRNGSAEIIGSYTLPTDMIFSANEAYLIGSLTLRMDRNLNTSTVEGEIKPLTMKAGDKLFFRQNEKRTDGEHTQDPDYTVSVQLTAEDAKVIIDNSKAGVAAWKMANQPQQVETQQAV